MKKSHSLDYFIEKADSRDAMHPNRFHFMVEHPSQGAFISNIYDPALADYAANGGSFAEPTEAFATVGLKNVDFSVIRHHANLRRAADAMSKSVPVKMTDSDFHQGMSAVNQVIMNVSDAVARNYGHGKSPDGMVYMPVPMSVAAVDEAGGHQYWPDTFKKREDYIENRGLGMDLDQEVDEVLNEAGDIAESSGDEGEEGADSEEADVESDSDDESEAESDLEESDTRGEDLKKSYDGINFTPPAGVRSACRAGLKLKEQGHGGEGLVSATVAWARRLAAGQKISPAKARKMNAWFARHSVGSSSRTLGDKTSPAWVAWQLWGGNAGKSWSAKLVKQMESRGKVKKSETPPPVPEGIAIYMTPKYLKDVAPDVLKSLTQQVSAAVNKEPSECGTSLSVEKIYSSEPLPTHSPSQTEKSVSTTTIAEAKSKTASPSPGLSAPLESSKRTEPLQQLPERPELPRDLLADPKVRQVLAASVLASLRGTIRPQSVVEALGLALTCDGNGMLRALEAGIIKAGDKPGPQAAPEGAVSRYADGTVVEKRGGKWHEVESDKGKPDEDRSQSGKGKKSDPKTKHRQAKALVGKLRERLSQMKNKGASEKEMSVVRSKIKQVKQRMRSMSKSYDPFAEWQRGRAVEQLKKSADYCKYMGYKRAEQLLYAVAADDTPSEITVAVKAATRTLGTRFSTLLEKAIK
jgi:hypothetical protein